MTNEPIAIIGLGCVLPDAPNVETFWNNLKAGKSSIREVSKDRWDPEVFYDPARTKPETTYTKIGAFVDDDGFDPLLFRMPPKAAEQIDPCQRWALSATRQALLDAGYETGLRGDEGRSFNRERTAVILGNAMGGEHNKTVTKRIHWKSVVASLESTPAFQAMDEASRNAMLADAQAAYEEGTLPITEDTMPGHLSNVAAGRVANAFNFRGKNCTTDAACASSFAALDLAVHTLRAGEADMVVWGGTDRSMDVTAYIQFSAIGALSPDGSRPFDASANGFVMGEGCAVFLLKRLSDAKRDGDHVYATIAAVGASSDGKGKGITAPNPEGQVLAVGRAWEAAGIDPQRLGVLEAHGTSTPVGDPVELQSVTTALEGIGAKLPHQSVEVGSVKSNIGHLKAAAGAAGLLKATLMLSEKTIPNSLGVTTPNPKLDWANSPFRVAQDAAWNERPEVAAISSFGFGGTNYHIILASESELPEPAPQVAEAQTAGHSFDLPPVTKRARVIAATPGNQDQILAAKDLAELERESLPMLTPGTPRVVAAVDAIEDLNKTIETAQRAQAQPAAAKLAANQGIFLGDGSGPHGKVAFLFPGQGSQYVGMGHELARLHPVVAETFAEADAALHEALGGKLTDILWPANNDAAKAEANKLLQRTEYTQPAVLAMDVAILRLLKQQGVTPDVVAGHSLGEYAALVAAGVLRFEDALHAVAARGREMANVDLPDLGKMASVGAPWPVVKEAIAGVNGYVVPANQNSPRQTVIAGESKAVEDAVKVLQEQGQQCIFLPVSAAFHSAIVAPASKPLRKVLARMDVRAPEVPVIGNVHAAPYEHDPEWIRDTLAEQVASPVKWIQTIERMHAEGVTTFIEVGPKRALSGMVMDILADQIGKTAMAMPSAHPKKGELRSLAELHAFLLSQGHTLDLEPKVAAPVAQDVPAVAPAAVVKTVVESVGYKPLAERVEALAEEIRKLEGQANTAAPGPAQAEIVASGVGLGLPGRNKPFVDEEDMDRLLRGENLIDAIPEEIRNRMAGKGIVRLVKGAAGQADFEAVSSPEEVIQLAGQRGDFDLRDWGVPESLIEVLDKTSQYAAAMAYEALKDAGIPLVQAYKTTSKGTQLPDGWVLPESMQADTGIIFASAFPGYDRLLEEIQRNPEESGFDRRFLFAVLSMGHAQVAQLLRAKGPNTQVNAACASTTQAITMAQDWISAGRCKRVLVLGADDATSPNLLEWIGSGFLAAGAATTETDVTQAALPFDARRHGMIVGMGAVGIVLETADEVAKRGMAPIATLRASALANSAYHGSRLDTGHIASIMTKLVQDAGLDPETAARETMFMSHETYTPARGGSASAEAQALRAAFGDHAKKVLITNTKGFTGHPQGAGLEDGIVLRCLQRQAAPPIPNLKEVDPEFTDLRLSPGGAQSLRYGLRLAAGFGSQVAMVLWEKGASEDARIVDAVAHKAFLERVAGSNAKLILDHRQLRATGEGATKAAAPTPKANAPVAAPVAAPTATGDLLAEVIDLVADRTGYPKDLLDADLDMESDLGIDTVKQAELIGELREIYQLEKDEELSIKDVNTLRKVADYVASRRTGGAPVAAAPTAAVAVAPAVDVLAQVIDLVADRTGYPKDLLDPTLDMESDLGIDTVKQAELIGELREQFQLAKDEELSIKDVNTLEKVAQYVQSRMTGTVAAAPVATAAPFTAPTTDVLAEVIALVADRTGYPVDLLDPALDMESDLGIDTVKQAELIGELREQYQLEKDEELSIKDVNTLQKVADYVASRMGAPVAAPVAVAAPAAAPSVDSQSVLTQVIALVADRTGYPTDLLDPALDMESDLGIDTVKQAELIGELREQFHLPKDEELSIKDVNTLQKVADYVASRAAKASVPTPAAVATEVAAPVATKAEGKRLVPFLQPVTLPEEPHVVSNEALILDATESATLEDLHQHLRDNPELAKQDLVLLTRQDGALGLHKARPNQAAMAGYFRSLAREWPEARVRIIDVHPAIEDVDELLTRAIALDEVQVAIDENGQAHVLRLLTEDLLAATPDVAGKTFIVSGGAQGITAKLLEALAPQKPNLVLLGRTPLPEGAEVWAQWTDAEWKDAEAEARKHIEAKGERVTPVSIQKALAPMRKAADVQTTINTLETLGATVAYAPVDVMDAEGLTKVASQAREAFGGIHGVIHAAGLEISKLIEDKPVEQLQQVLGVKQRGLEAMLAATQQDALEFLVGFSSVAARFGNAGQVDYAAGNAWLAARIQEEARNRNIATAFTIGWGPWDEVGMATKGSIRQVLESQGVEMLPVKDGVAAFVGELGTQGIRELDVAAKLGALAGDGWIVTERPDPELEAKQALLANRWLLHKILRMDDDGVEAEILLDAAAHTHMDHHRVNGTPVLAGVLGLEAFAQTATLLQDAEVTQLSNVEFQRAFKQLKDAPVRGVVFATIDGDVVHCELRSRAVGPNGEEVGDWRTHFVADVTLGARDSPPKTQQIPRATEGWKQEDLYPPYFHGDAFQVLAHAMPEGVADFRSPPTALDTQAKTYWTHPLLLEALFQLAGLQPLIEGRMHLPASIECVDLWNVEAPTQLWCQREDKVDGAVCDTEGNVALRMLGFGMVDAGPANSTFHDAEAPTESSAELPVFDEMSFAAVVVDGAKPETWLHPKEVQKLAELSVPKRAKEFLAGRLAIKLAVRKLDGSLDPKDIHVQPNAQGAPKVFVGERQIALAASITHSDGLAIAALAPGALGIDLESVTERPASFLDEAFSGREVDSIQGSSNPAQAATMRWAAKEAVLKRYGVGLQVSLSKVETKASEAGTFVEGPWGNWGVQVFDVGGQMFAVSHGSFDA